MCYENERMPRKPKGAPVPAHVDRFESYYTRKSPKECWLWKGPVNGHGVPQLSRDGRMVTATRVAVEVATGETLKPKQVVSHKKECKNLLCVNPQHLVVKRHPKPPGFGRPKKHYQRTTVYLPGDVLGKLKDESRDRAKPMGEIIVEALGARVVFTQR